MTTSLPGRRFFLPASILLVSLAVVVWRGDRSVGDPKAVHQVESLEELVVRLDECVTVAALECPHLVYVWSRSMPLSLDAMDEIALTAEAIGTPLSLLPASALQGPASSDAAAPMEALRAGMVAAGATVHFPSIVVFDKGTPRGNAIVGHKRAEGYRRLIEPRLADLAAGRIGEPAPLGAPDPPASVATNTQEASLDISVQWTYPMPAPAPGFFFRRVPGTRFITFDQSGRVHLLELETSERLLGPGWIDFVPSPDGKLFVTPAPGNRGLEFYVASEVLRIARTGAEGRFATAFMDPELADQYPSVGILAEDPDGRSTTYRILVSWFSGLAVRDYEVRWGEGGTADITPLTPKIAACPGMGLSTPIMSKDGREIAARDESTGTTKIFRVDGEGSCTELFDIGHQTSKVGFSDDGRLIAYSSPNASSRSTTYVLDRQGMRTTMVPGSESVGLVIPEMVGADSLLLLIREDIRSAASEFRLFCCVR